MSSIVKYRGLHAIAFALLLNATAIACGILAGTVNAKAGDALYSAIIVDIEPIRSTGLGDFANPIGAAVKRSLNKTYAGLIDAKNKSLPTLVVEVESYYYGQEEERSILNLRPRFTHTRDEMSGTAIIRKGKSELKHVTILGVHDTPGGWQNSDNADRARMQALADRFADAVRDELGN